MAGRASIVELAERLGRALAESEEAQALKEARKQLEEHAAAKIMWDDLVRRERELQRRLAAGEAVSEEEKQQVAELFRLASYNPYIQRLLEAEYRFTQLMLEVQQVMGKAAGLPFALEEEGAAATQVDAGQPGSTTNATEAGDTGRESTASSNPDLTVARRRIWVPGDPL
ncbi:MAG: YlbF family regulator [Limnochordales bacterium]|nr:YlbF family regulator [Limnochordales bacterium]